MTRIMNRLVFATFALLIAVVAGCAAEAGVGVG
jgi:hypothetical protein